jgi:hypothetical protein
VIIDKRPQHIYSLACWSELRDPAGHFVNLKDSQIGFKTQLRKRGGGDVSDAELHGAAPALQALANELEVVANYEFEKPVSVTQAVKPWAPRKSEHFNTQSPEGWDWPTECYLLRSERIWRILHEVTARTRKRDIDLSWHGSRVSLGGTFGMAMPISGLHEAFDPYHYPQPIVHEMLHAFGYPHGDEMRYRHGLALKRLRAFRWYVAEHPEYVGG